MSNLVKNAGMNSQAEDNWPELEPSQETFALSLSSENSIYGAEFKCKQTADF